MDLSSTSIQKKQLYIAFSQNCQDNEFLSLLLYYEASNIFNTSTENLSLIP